MHKPRIKKPSKDYCLLMAHYFWVNNCPKMMWDWLVMWGFHEMYLEVYAG